MLDRYHSAPEAFDDALDALICEQKAEVLRKRTFFNFRAQPYFSPSSASADKRELYMKLTGAPKDIAVRPPYQGRWTRIGTAIGDVIQRDLLFIERHYERLTGEAPPFTVERTADGLPMWEDFAKKLHVVDRYGRKFALFGKPDGILRYKDGRRVGLEIKSKQTTAAKTSTFSMTDPEDKHVAQCVVYTEMYGTDAEPLDDYLVVYVNGAKKSWVMADDDYEKNPDLRVFHVEITDGQRDSVLGELVDVVSAVKAGTPPPLDLEKWTFNNFKTACALSLSDTEYADLESLVIRVLKSRMPEWKKRPYYDALQQIKQIRGMEAA